MENNNKSQIIPKVVQDSISKSEGYKPQRLAKVIARAGICSRRKAEEMIEAGRVMVNSEVITRSATNVSASDIIVVDGTKLSSPEATRIWLFHKPKGCITSNLDPQGRPTIFDFLPKNLPRVLTVGRLDYNTEGLLVLTNDGEFARSMELPANRIVREYRVRIHGLLTPEIINKLKGGVIIDGVKYSEIIATPEKQGINSWVNVKLIEGKNREIRKVFEHFNLEVSRLIRIAYGEFKLGSLEKGMVIEVR